MKFAENIKGLRKSRSLTQETVSRALGIGRGRWAKYEEGRAEPPLDLLRRIAEYFDVSLDLLLKREEQRTQEHSEKKVGKKSEGGVQVEVIPGEATAGYLSGYGDPEYMERLERMELPFLSSGKLRAFPVRGDSMLPVEDGSYVIGRYLEEGSRLKDGRTYVVVSRNEGISYKRVWKDVQKDGTLMLVPDNKLYRPYRIDVRNVLELWEYVGHLTLSTSR